MTTIGLLLPRSTFYDTISFEFREGFNRSLRSKGVGDFRIVTENIGFGAEKQSVYRAAERLLLDENADIIFAYIGHRTAQLLRPLFQSAHRMLIVLDAGAHLPQEWPSSPNIFYHSLHESLGAWLTAELAIRDGYKEGAMITNYYDGGYLHTAALTASFVNNGGKIQFNVATGYKEEEFSMEAVPGKISEFPSTCLLSLFSGDFCQWYFRELKARFNGAAPPVYLSPFGCEETMLTGAEFPAGVIVKGIVPWTKNVENSENKIFVGELEEAGRKANYFSLLGWEAGSLAILFHEIAQALKKDYKAVGEELKKQNFQTPRGTIHFHAGTNTSLSPMYEVTIVNDGHGRCRLLTGGPCENISDAFEKMISLELNEASSGWYNSYGCN